MNRPTRILLFSTLYPSVANPRHGIFVETRLKHLLKHPDIEARVVAPVPWFPRALKNFGRWSKWAETPFHEIRNNVPVWHPRYPLPPKIGMSVAPILMALAARATLANWIKEGFDFDLIDAHYYYPDGAAAALLSRWFNKPLVVTARGSDINLLPNYAIPRQWIKWTESQAAASITVSHALRDRLLELGGKPDRVQVLPNGVDLNMFQVLDRSSCRQELGLLDGRWLISVGNLVESKGHSVAISALTRLPVNYNLAIIGDGEDRNRLQKLAAELDVADRVIFVSAVTQAKLNLWYNAADALLLCSTREGLPNVVLEALACGTPVAATDVGGIPEIINTTVVGRLLKGQSASELATIVLDIQSEKPDRRAIRAHASTFDWAKTTQGQIDIFRAIS